MLTCISKKKIFQFSFTLDLAVHFNNASVCHLYNEITLSDEFIAQGECACL